MRILFIEPYYHPDGGPAAPLYTMLCEELAKMGHDVTILASVPHYPTGKVNKDYRGWRTLRTFEKGVNVIRVPLPSINRSILWQRYFQFLIYQIGVVLAGWKIKAEIFSTATPSFMVLLPVIYFSIIRRIPFIYNVHDVYPDSGVKLGIFKNNLIIRFVTRLEKLCARRSAFVRILSPSYADGVSQLGIAENKLILIYDWVDTTLIKPVSRDNNFSIEYNLHNKFVVEYAGNISFSQGLDCVLDAAAILEDEEIHFLLIGEGAAKFELEKKSQEKSLHNIQFLPFQPREILPQVLGSADISLVILKKGMGFNSLPSKTLSLLASGRPIIASIDPGSETCKLVERARSGVCVAPEDPVALANTILQLKRDRNLLQNMSKNGRQYAMDNHSPVYAAEAFEVMFIKALTTPN